MRKMLVIVIIVIATSSVALGQMKTSRDTNNSVEAPLSPWKNKRGKRGRKAMAFFFNHISQMTLWGLGKLA